MTDQPESSTLCTLVITTRLRDGTMNFRKLTILNALLPKLYEKLEAQETIREFTVFEAREMFHHHKSYAEDFTPTVIADVIQRMASAVKSPETPD